MNTRAWPVFGVCPVAQVVLTGLSTGGFSNSKWRVCLTEHSHHRLCLAQCHKVLTCICFSSHPSLYHQNTRLVPGGSRWQEPHVRLKLCLAQMSPVSGSEQRLQNQACCPAWGCLINTKSRVGEQGRRWIKEGKCSIWSTLEIQLVSRWTDCPTGVPPSFALSAGNGL